MTTREEEQRAKNREAVRRLLERRFMAVGERFMAGIEEQQALYEERKELEEMWRLGAFGEPPAWQPTFRLVAAG